MSTLLTNFDVAPYYDDFNANNQYYRILFKPSYAVQARELTQLQTILQNQISLGSSYKDGTIVEGCGFTEYPNLAQVKFKDSNTITLDFATITTNHSDLANANILVSNTTGLRALVFRAFVGAESAVNVGSNDTNRAYLIYGTSGNNAGVEVSVFNSTSEKIDVFSANQSFTGPLVSTNYLGSIYTLSSNNTVNTYGQGYGLHVSQGTIYQKGYYLKVQPDNVVIREHVANAIGMKVGFDTAEYIVKAAQDSSLYDNSIGSPNYSAPGADRVKLVPSLFYYDASNTQVTIPQDFLTIIDYSGGTGAAVTANKTPQLAQIGDEMALRTMEQTGNFVAIPFQINVIADPSGNNNNFAYSASPGTAYVDGYRVQYLSARQIISPRATTTTWQPSQKVTTNFGNYIKIRDVAGTFDVGNDQSVIIYNANQSVLSLNQSYVGSGIGTAVGTANIRALLYSPTSPAPKGYPKAEYLGYIFNIKMNSGYSFATDAKSIVVTGGTYGNCYADIYTDPIQGQQLVYEPDKATLIYNTGLPGVKRLTSNTGVDETSYVYRSTLTSTITRTTSGGGGANNTTITFTAPGTDSFNYGLGTLTDIGETGINITFGTNFSTNPILGPWTSESMNPSISFSNSTTSTLVTGDYTSNFDGTTPGASLMAQLTPGQGIKLNWGNPLGGTATSYHTVLYVNNANSVTLTPNVSSTVVPLSGTVAMSRFYKQGTSVDFTGSGNTITFTTPSNATVVLAIDANTSQATTYTMNGQIPTQKTAAVPIQKVVNKGVYVGINCASHWASTTGPWNLGIPDVYEVTNVYVGSTFDTANYDAIGWFGFTSGQQDSYYGHGQLYVLPQFKQNITSSTRMLVKLNCFSANITSVKEGFFSVDSYPIDDANTANLNAIQTAQIPIYKSISGINYDLRNNIDFRPIFANTAIVASTNSTWGSYTVNPANNNSTIYTGSGNPIAVEPNANFTYNVEYYLPRIDSLLLNSDGTLDVKHGIPDVNPVTPSLNSAGLKLADIYVPPYPSLTFTESE